MLSSHLLASALESAPDAIVIIDDTGHILFANRQVFSLFGYSAAEVAGKKIELLLPERFRHRHIEHRSGYTHSVRVRPMGMGLDLFALHKKGGEFPVEVSLSPIQHEGRMMVAAAIRDVTERRQTQRELVAAREAADRANLAKSRFLATASHDLRQPLQSLALLNGALRRLATDPSAAEAIAQQGHAIESMSRLLNALLDISKLESGAIRPEVADFSVSDMLDRLQREFATLAAAKGLRLEVNANNIHAKSDQSLVEQVLRNLVANAIKYTRAGTVKLECIRDDASVRLSVSDTGIGIPADQLPYIYDEFYQVGVGPNSAREGYGLGLSIVRRVASLLGLTLDVSSELGKGTTFSLRLPLSDAVPAAGSDVVIHAPRDIRGPAPHVLLVEDDAGVRDATRLLLKVEGYRVTTASALQDALQAAREHPDIALLITDYHLPQGTTGIQVIHAVRELSGRELPAVLITGDTSAAMREIGRTQDLRIASKPVNADELLAELAKLLS